MHSMCGPRTESWLRPLSEVSARHLQTMWSVFPSEALHDQHLL